MSKQEEKMIKRLELLGASAGVLLILAAIGVFVLEDITQQLMILAVGCGMVLNAVLMILNFHKGKRVSSLFLLVFVLILTVVFIIQVMSM